MDIYYRTVKLILGLYRLLFYQCARAGGRLPLPPGPKIIAANHANCTDGFHLPCLFSEKLHCLIQGDIFQTPLLGPLLARSGQVPVWPGRKNAALEQACRLLQAGKTVLIFPEGRLNPGRLPFKASTGAVRLSLLTGAPLVPAGFFVPGQFLRRVVLPKEGRKTEGLWQTGGCCYIRFGAPWLPQLDDGAASAEDALAELTAGLMKRINAMVDQAAQEYAAERGWLSADQSAWELPAGKAGRRG